MTELYGSGRFCSRSCANSRILSDETKNKISSSVSITRNTFEYHQRTIDRYNANPKHCVICGKPISYEHKNNSTCGDKRCLHKLHQLCGLKSANSVSKRSKNEIYFYELCKNKFNNTLHNVPMFNGWDADIIIPEIKCAVLWNGVWHYKKVCENHSLMQVQNRDKIKIKEIEGCGYTSYIIKDVGRYNKKFVEEQFDIFINTLYNNNKKD